MDFPRGAWKSPYSALQTELLRCEGHLWRGKIGRTARHAAQHTGERHDAPAAQEALARKRRDCWRRRQSGMSVTPHFRSRKLRRLAAILRRHNSQSDEPEKPCGALLRQNDSALRSRRKRRLANKLARRTGARMRAPPSGPAIPL